FRHFAKLRVVEVVSARPALPAPAEAGHAPLDVKEESLALLLPVIHDVEAALDLALDDRAHGRESRAIDFDRVYDFAADTSSVHLQQRRWPRQAASVRREDAVLAVLNGGVTSTRFFILASHRAIPAQRAAAWDVESPTK